MILLAVLLLSSLPFLGMDGPSHDQSNSLLILSFNVREWTRDTDESQDTYWKRRMEAMEKMIGDVNPDIICLQEVLPPVGRYIPDEYRTAGVSVSHPIYVRKGLKVSKHRFSIFWESCIVQGVKIINVHSRWESKIVARTVSQVNSLLTGRDVACGDWNTSLTSIKNAGLQMDSAREILGIAEEDTFANFTRPDKSHGAIDHYFVKGVSPTSYRMITEGYGVSKMSDHFPIVLRIAY